MGLGDDVVGVWVKVVLGGWIVSVVEGCRLTSDKKILPLTIMKNTGAAGFPIREEGMTGPTAAQVEDSRDADVWHTERYRW